MSNFAGIWKTDTMAFPGGGGAFQAELRFQGGNVKNIHHEFADIGGPHISTSCRRSRYAVVKEPEPGTYEIELTATSSSITVLDPNQAAEFSAKSTGGFEQWMPGEEKDVTGLNLLGHSYSSVGEKSSMCVRVEGDGLETSVYPGLIYRCLLP
jgi:hypothetical protein